MSETNISFSEDDIQVLFHVYKKMDIWRSGDLSAPFWRIIHNDLGISELFFKKNIQHRRLSLPQSILVLIPPGVEYSCSNSSSIMHMEIAFLINGAPYFVKESFLSFPYEGLHREMIENLKKGESSNCDLLSARLVISLLTSFSLSPIKNITDDFRLNKAIIHMKQNWDIPLSNSVLAGESKMSVNGFARLFRDRIGITPYEYQLMIRIDRACILLHNTDIRIDDIARKSGFLNRFHFSKTFKQLKGLTPVEYRKSKI